MKNKLRKINNIITYKYPPIYKYGFLLLVIYMFMKYQKIMTNDKLLINSIIITLIILIVDNIIINNHPMLFTDTIITKHNNEYFDIYDYDNHEDDDDVDIERIRKRFNLNPKTLSKFSFQTLAFSANANWYNSSYSVSAGYFLGYYFNNVNTTKFAHFFNLSVGVTF